MSLNFCPFEPFLFLIVKYCYFEQDHRLAISILVPVAMIEKQGLLSIKPGIFKLPFFQTMLKSVSMLFKLQLRPDEEWLMMRLCNEDDCNSNRMNNNSKNIKIGSSSLVHFYSIVTWGVLPSSKLIVVYTCMEIINRLKLILVASVWSLQRLFQNILPKNIQKPRHRKIKLPCINHGGFWPWFKKERAPKTQKVKSKDCI